MRTAIFVYNPTTVSIETNEDKLCLVQMGTSTIVPLDRSNKIQIERGIYKVKSSTDVTVSGDLTQIAIQVITNNKDPFPDPPLNAQALAGSSGDPVTAIQKFFVVPDERKLDHF